MIDFGQEWWKKKGRNEGKDHILAKRCLRGRSVTTQIIGTN
jgi:hypothetical protein